MDQKLRAYLEKRGLSSGATEEEAWRFFENLDDKDTREKTKDKINTGTQYRTFELVRAEIDEEARTVPLSFSSEEPYKRWWGTEILDHSPGAVRLGRIKQLGPLLVDHNHRDQVGVIEDIEITKDRIGRAVVRFGKGARADEIYQDVIDGIRGNVSVGYQIHRMVLEEETDDEEIYRAKDWEPFEVSIVSVPADITVGVGRNATGDHITVVERSNSEPEKPAKPVIKEKDMDPKLRAYLEKRGLSRTATDEEAWAFFSKIDDGGQQRDIAQDVEKILEIAEKHDAHALATKHVRAGSTVDAFLVDLLDAKKDARQVQETPQIGLTQKEARKYSVVRALNALANPTDRLAQEAAAFEREVSEAVGQHLSKSAEGLFMPAEVMQRDLVVGTDTAGGHLVETDLQAGSFIELLRNAMVCRAMGARVLSGLVGDVAIPRQTGGATAYWVAESGSPTEGQQAFDQVTLAPKTVGAFTDISRKLLKQSSVDIENLVMMDLAAQLAIAIDQKALYGDGTSNTPTGIANTSGINAPTAFAAAVPTYAELLAMKGSVAADNALMGSLGFVLDPATAATLEATPRFTSASFGILEGDKIGRYKAMESSQITAGDVFFGNWVDLIIGQWGTLDLTVDPYTGSTAGTVRVVGLQDVDIAVRHAVSFAYNNDGA